MKRNITAILIAFLVTCNLFSSTGICAEANDGSSPEKAIKVANISNFSESKDIKEEYKKSISQEYSYHLPVLFGVEGKDWKVANRRLITKDGKYVDQLQVVLIPSKNEKMVYFDVTESYVKYIEARNKQKK